MTRTTLFEASTIPTKGRSKLKQFLTCERTMVLFKEYKSIPRRNSTRCIAHNDDSCESCPFKMNNILCLLNVMT